MRIWDTSLFLFYSSNLKVCFRRSRKM